MPVGITLLGMTLCYAAFPAAGVDRPSAVPVRRIFASEDGRYGVRVTAVYKDHKVESTTLDLFRFDNKGEEVRVWQRSLDFVPVRVLVSDSAIVVTLNEWGRAGYKHSLVLLDDKGGTVADFELEALLTPEEISSNVSWTVSSRSWDAGATFSFYRQNLLIKHKWGKETLIDLSSGKIVEP